MRTHIVLAHPEPNSFNGHLASLTRKTVESAGGTVTISDLYAQGFDPVEGAQHFEKRANQDAFHAQTEQRFSADSGTIKADIATEIENLLACELLVVHFPLWWFGPPAILKGWMDRTFVYGKLYKSDMRYDAGICAGKKMIACVTTGASAESCAHNGREGDTKLHLWPVLFPFRYLGFDVLEPAIFHGIGGVSFMEGHDDKASALNALEDEWVKTFNNHEERSRVRYNADTDFDQTKRLRPEAQTYSPFIRQTE